MARTRSMTAPKLRRSGRKQLVPAPAVKMSKPTGISKKMTAVKPKPKPKTIRVPAASTASKISTRGSKRKATEIEDEEEVPAPQAKRAKATPAPAPRKPATHRYGTRSKRLSSPLPPSPPAVPVSLPARLSLSPEREPGEEQGGDRNPSPSLPSPPPPPAPAPAPAPSPPRPVSQLPLPAFEFASLHPTNPVPIKNFSGKPLSRLAAETGGPLKRRELPAEKELKTLDEIRDAGKLPRGNNSPVLKACIVAGYMAEYKAESVVADPDGKDPRVIRAHLENAEERAYRKRDEEAEDWMELRQEEKSEGYGVAFRRRNHPNTRLEVRTKYKRWSTSWKRKLFAFRQTVLLERKKSGQKWEVSQVHDHSPLVEDCSAILHEDERLRVLEEKFWAEEAERARLAREQFEAERAAGLLEDADEYGDDYDPYEEDY